MASLPKFPRLIGRADPISSTVRVMGQSFSNCLGIAAGIDRTGELLSSLNRLNCGHVEVGTIFDPRDLRISGDADFSRTRIGINIGSSKPGFSAEVLADYNACLAGALSCADFIVLNFSNEVAIRSLKSDASYSIVAKARRQVGEHVSCRGMNIPLLAKVSAGASGEDLPMLRAAIDELDGFVVVGGCVDRIAEFRQAMPHHCIVSVGGVRTGKDAWARIRAGADLVQIHRVFTEDGPEQVAQILRDLNHGVPND